VCINFLGSCLWGDKGHVVEWRNQEAIVEHAKMNVLLKLEVACISGFKACLWGSCLE
jgi:hypothetical protein